MMYKIANNEADHHDITEILLKMALNTIKQTNNKIANKNVAITKNDLLKQPLRQSSQLLFFRFQKCAVAKYLKKIIDLRAFQDICQSWNSNILICKNVHVTYVYGFWLLSRKKLIEHGLFQERYQS